MIILCIVVLKPSKTHSIIRCDNRPMAYQTFTHQIWWVMVCYDLAHQIRYAKHTFSGWSDIPPTVCCSFGGHSTPQNLQCGEKKNLEWRTSCSWLVVLNENIQFHCNHLLYRWSFANSITALSYFEQESVSLTAIHAQVDVAIVFLSIFWKSAWSTCAETW